MKTNMRAITDHFAKDSTPLVAQYQDADHASVNPTGTFLIAGRSTVDGRPLYVPVDNARDNYDGGFIFESGPDKLSFIERWTQEKVSIRPISGHVLELKVANATPFTMLLAKMVLENDARIHEVACSRRVSSHESSTVDQQSDPDES